MTSQRRRHTPDFVVHEVRYKKVMLSATIIAFPTSRGGGLPCLVLDEVARADARRREEILGKIAGVRPILLRRSQQADDLAGRGAPFFAQRRVGDARFCETFPARESVPHPFLRKGWGTSAAVCEMDVLASWNQRHLANIRRRDLFNSVNRVAGYRKMLEIANPLEVLYE